MRRKWTKTELDYLETNYADMPSAEIAKHLNRSISSIYMAAQMNVLTKSPDYMKKCLEREGEKLKILGKSSRFEKGHQCHNKGKKMPKEIYEKVKTTFFKAGHEPHNIKYDGHERICAKDGYIYTRISKGKYKLKHRLIWEQHNGPIPKNFIVVFKDGNKLNCCIENLQMITKEENMERNRVTKYPIELQQLIKFNNQIKRKLNEKQN